MALTERGDGTGPAFLVSSDWWNDFYDLLTGAMQDQAVILNYRPGSGTTPTLMLKGDGFGDLLQGFKTDDSTEAFSFDSDGNLSLAGVVTSNSKPVYNVDGNGTTAGHTIYLGTSTPGSPSEGDIWIKA